MAKDDLLHDIDPETLDEVINFFHKMELNLSAADSWFDLSIKSLLKYKECEGEKLLNWKQNGYKTIFDILMV